MRSIFIRLVESEVSRTQFLVRDLAPGDVVIMDNLGSHKGDAVRETIEGAGAEILLPPPYSPDLNPIGQIFAKLKH